MKKTFYIIGGTAVGLLVVGVILFILAGWGSLVEYHAFEWRGVQHKGASPLTRATGNLSYCFLGTGFLAGVIAFIPFFITAIRNSRKTHKKYPEQNKTPLTEDQNQINS